MKWGVHSGYTFSYFYPKISKNYNVEKMKYYKGYLAGLIYRSKKSDIFSNTFELTYEIKGIDSILVNSHFKTISASFECNYFSFNISANVSLLKDNNYFNIYISPGFSFAYLLKAKADGYLQNNLLYPPKITFLPKNYTDNMYKFDVASFLSIEFDYFNIDKIGFFGEFKISYSLLPTFKNEFNLKHRYYAILAGIFYKY